MLDIVANSATGSLVVARAVLEAALGARDLQSSSGRARVLLEEFHGVADGLDLLGGIIGNLAAEFLLERHHQLDGIEAVGAQIIDEARVVGDLVGLDPEVLDNDLLHALLRRRSLVYPSALSLIHAVAVCHSRPGHGRQAHARN